LNCKKNNEKKLQKIKFRIYKQFIRQIKIKMKNISKKEMLISVAKMPENIQSKMSTPKQINSKTKMSKNRKRRKRTPATN
jgi:hypothetical protein